MKKINKFVILCVIILISCILLLIPTLKNINFGLDLQGGFEILYKIEPLEKNGTITEEDLNNTYKAIVNRIDTLGVSEPVISFEGKDLLRIQLPGVKDETEAKQIISTIGLLSFRDTSDNLLMTSSILGRKGASTDTSAETLRPVVKLNIKDTTEFYNVTNSISKKEDNRIVIWLDFDESSDSFSDSKETCGEETDNKCLSAAYVEEGLNSNEIVIQGNFTKEKVERLASLINAGSLPTKLSEDSTPHSVSATFGGQTIKRCAVAGIITLLVISLLLIIKYRFSGFISSISLIVYTLLSFLIFNAIGGVLTLPGIAALILGVGMAVDSAIILIERIKDEYKDNLKEAYLLGSKSSLTSIIDANVTTLLIAIILYIFGQSSIKGFALMLIISIIVTIISMIIINRFLIKNTVNTKYFEKKSKCFFGNKNKTSNFNFIKINKFGILAFSGVFVLGIIFYFVNGFNLGIDFSGGTSINLISEDEIDLESVNILLKDYEIDKSVYYVGTTKEANVKTNQIIKEEDKNIIINSLNEKNIDVSINEISNLVSKSLTKNALYSLIISFVAMIIYVAIRFNFNFGFSGIVALLHDVLLIFIGFLLFNLQFNFIIIVAFLTIIGYSINDTIVIFDRLRENKKKLFKNKIKSKEDLVNLVNVSMNQVLIRNIFTTLTTLLAVLSLIILGINEIFTFNIAIVIGLLGGFVSSCLFAPNIWMFLEKRKLNKPEKEEKNNEIDELSIKGINS